MTTFDSATVQALAAQDEIDIETTGTGGQPHRTTIWVVTDGPDVFVRSVRGPQGRWYREASVHADVVVHAGDRRIEARATHATDAESVRRVSDAYRAKYAASEHMASMVRDEIHETTMRLEPR